MRISVLMENTAGSEALQAEHGLSLFVETKRHKILFDTGQSGAFADNAARMGVDLSQVDLAILSHGHYDHGGGLKRFLELNSTAPIYVNQNAFAPHGHGTERDIGLDPQLARDPRFHLVGDSKALDEELELYTCNGRPMPYGLDSAGLTMWRDGSWVPEDFCHEQYLAVHEDGRTVLFSGCSHKGILNIQTWFQPDVLIGGFHLSGQDPETPEGAQRLEQTAQMLSLFPTRYWTGHCTGRKQYAFLKQRMGGQLNALTTGTVLDL